MYLRVAAPSCSSRCCTSRNIWTARDRCSSATLAKTLASKSTIRATLLKISSSLYNRELIADLAYQA